MDTQIVFSIMFVIFALIMVSAGIFTKKWVSETSDYILAGREVSLLINIMGVSAIGFAGTTVSLTPIYNIMELKVPLYGVYLFCFWAYTLGCCFQILSGMIQTLLVFRNETGRVKRSCLCTFVGLCGI